MNLCGFENFCKEIINLSIFKRQLNNCCYMQLSNGMIYWILSPCFNYKWDAIYGLETVVKSCLWWASRQDLSRVVYAGQQCQKNLEAKGAIRCFSFAFDNSKTRLEKIRFKSKFSNKRKTSTKRRTFFIQAKIEIARNCFCISTRTKSATPTLLFVSFRQL